MPWRRLLLPLALVCSGFAALAVEVLWLRLLSRLLGGSAQAVAAILVAYMGGLAIGSAAAARRADRWDQAKCQQYYVRAGAVDLGGGVDRDDPARRAARRTGWMAGQRPGRGHRGSRCDSPPLCWRCSSDHGHGRDPPPGGPRGGANPQGSFLRGTALLYAANTLGAAGGALAAPFLLLPMGVRAAALVAACGSLVAAGLASLYTAPGQGVPEAPAPGPAPRSAAPVLSIAALACCSGAAALGLEVLWTRWLTPLAGSSTHSFGIVLALVLLGIVVGSGLVSLAGKRIADPASLAGLLAILGALLAAALMPLIDRIPDEFLRLVSNGELNTRSSATTLLTVAALVIIPGTVCFGAVLPLAARAARAQGDDGARAVGMVYSVNTVGALAASASVGLVLIPTIGLGRTVAALLLPSVLMGTFIVCMRSGNRLHQALTIALGLGGVWAVLAAHTPSAMRAAAAVYHPRKGAVRLGRVLYYREGPEGPALVLAAGATRVFFVSGRSEAADGWLDVRTQYLIGHLPALLAGGAARSLVIGLGSGMTAGALTRHGSVTIAELNPAVPAATRQFDHRNHRVLDSAHLTLEDGRVVLLEPGPSSIW